MAQFVFRSLFPNLRFFNNFFGSFSKNRVFLSQAR